MMAAPFDAGALRVTGEAVPVAENVAVRALSRADVAISASGTLLYAAGRVIGGNGELVWVARDGKATAVDSSFAHFFIGRVRLSPDGRQAAVSAAENVGSRTLWVKQLDHGPATKIVGDAGPQSWSPDGKLLLVSATSGLLLARSDGSAPPTALATGHTAPSFAEISADGKWVVYVEGDNIRAMRLGADTTKLLLVEGAREQSPAVSPDGRWLAYSSEESGRAEVYVRPFPDTKASKRQVSVAGGASPRWSRDGRELFFVNESRHMVAVPVASGQTLVAGEPKPLFNLSANYATANGFDVARDGRFLMIRLVGSAAALRDEIVLVENFFQELEGKVKAK
jgi:dipeptidyl aminopeptidase/acylaminoacyl peptidase